MPSKAFRDNYQLIRWHPLPAIPRAETTLVSRSELPAPMIVRDEMKPVQSQATGKIYDSKSAIRREYKTLGMEEIGNDPYRLKPRPRPKIDRQAIKRTVLKAEARFNRGERAK